MGLALWCAVVARSRRLHTARYSWAHRSCSGVHEAIAMLRDERERAGHALPARSLLDGVGMKLEHVLVWLALPACAVDVGTGTASQSIIGGVPAQPADYPTVVALEESPGQWFCTGTLIADRWVLTAAHCVEGTAPTGVSVRFDDANVNDAAGGKVVAVAEVHSHPEFDWDAWDNDIALLRLADAVTDRAPTPILRDAVAVGTSVTDVGYGVADNNDGGGGILRKVDKVTADCAGANDPGISGANLICMNASDGKGSCFGDSGGPTFVRNGNALVVAGVTSGGSDELCGTGWDLYTSVHAELGYIDSVMMAAPPADPDPQPDPDPDPEPDPTPDPGDSTGGGEGGGCNTGGGNGGLLLAGLVAWLARRRR